MAGKDGGWRLPAVIDPPERICVCIPVPDEPAHRQAFWGALTELGYQHNWERNAGHDAVPVSVLWYSIVAAAQAKFYSGVRTMCFSCEELAECLAPLLEQQTAEFQRMLNQNKYGDPTTPGDPMPIEKLHENLSGDSNPGCDLEILCGQCQGVIRYLVDTMTAVLNAAEAATNTVEFIHVITQITGIDETSADAVVGYVTFVQEAIAEGYIAQASPTYIEEATCSLYCRTQIDCVISADDVYQVFRNRLQAAIGGPVPAFETLVDMFQFLYGVPMSGTIIADVMHLIVAGGGVLANVFLGDVGTKTLQTLVELAADEPSNDCSVLCDCPDCSVGYNIVVGTDDDPDIIPDVQAEIQTLVDPLLTLWGRRIILEFVDEYDQPVPVTQVTFSYTWAGSPDSVYGKLGAGETVNGVPASASGTITVYSEIPSPAIIIDCGYSTDPLYPPERYAAIYDVIACA